jgi:hypothetical protein
VFALLPVEIAIPIQTLKVWADPRDWLDSTYLAHFKPDSSWNKCAGANTPGAFDCDGTRLGVSIEPFAEFVEGSVNGVSLTSAFLNPRGV